MLTKIKEFATRDETKDAAVAIATGIAGGLVVVGIGAVAAAVVDRVLPAPIFIVEVAEEKIGK